MIIEQRMSKAIAYFAGGFGIAVLDTAGDTWKFTVRRPRFDDMSNVLLDEGSVEIFAPVVKEHGLEQGFMRALDRMHSLHG